MAIDSESDTHYTRLAEYAHTQLYLLKPFVRLQEDIRGTSYECEDKELYYEEPDLLGGIEG
jgi:hypothetical protein